MTDLSQQSPNVSYSTDSLGNVVGLVSSNGGVLGLMQNSIVPSANTSAGINAAVAAIVATGKPGVVIYQAADYMITAPITMASNVSHIGVAPAITFTGNVPDANFSASGGTRFLVSGGITAFPWNNVNKGTDEINIATFSLGEVKLFGLTFIGGYKAVDIGAYRAMGCVFCEFDQLYGFDQTSDFAFDFKNFQHTQFGRIYASSSPSILTGGGVRFASQLSNTLLPGNSQVTGEIFTYCSNRLNRSIVIEASGPSGCVLNEFKVAGRLQGNRYGLGTPDVIVFTSNSTATFTVPDGTKFQVGIPVVFHSTAPANFTVDVVYFVFSLVGNAIQLSENPFDTVAITAGSTSTYNVSLSGWPALQITAPLTANAIQNSDFGLVDAEAYGNVAAIVIAKARNSAMRLGDFMTSQTGTGLVTRDAEIGISYSGLSTVTQDRSANHGDCSVTNSAGGPWVVSSAGITLDSSWNNRKVRYTGTADFTITVPLNLPKGFAFEITPTAATGVVTFTPASGGLIAASGSTLRTLGQYATAKLQNIGNGVFSLTGNLQV